MLNITALRGGPPAAVAMLKVTSLRPSDARAVRLFGTASPVRDRDAAAASPALSLDWMRAQFRRMDDGAGGPVSVLRRWLKFRWRCLAYRPALVYSVSAFRDPAWSVWQAADPMLVVRPLRTYLHAALGPEQRAAALVAHFQWWARQVQPAAAARLYTQGPIDLVGAASPVPGLGLWLDRAAGFGREGELALHLVWQGERVMTLVFSVLTAADVGSPQAQPGERAGRRLVIGALQGAKGGLEALQALSAAAQRLRPAALLIEAAQALGTAWRLDAPLCVRKASHVYAGYASSRRGVGLDYDETWLQAGATPWDAHYWCLPAQSVYRPEADVESRKRAQHRRRVALRRAWAVAIQQSATVLLADPSERPVPGLKLSPPA